MPQRITLLILLFLALGLPPRAVAIDIAGPLSLDGVRELRRTGRLPKDIVPIIQQRGVSFDVDDAAERSLKGMGFRRSMIEKIRSAETLGRTDGGEPAEVAHPPQRPPQPNPAPQEEAAHQAFAARIAQINAASGVSLRMIPGMGVTVVADGSSAAKHLPLIRQVEAVIHKNFPAPLGTGPDRRSTYLVLLRTQANYERWVKTMFAVNHQSGISQFDARQLQAALMAAGSLPPGIAVVNLNKTGTWSRRTIVFNMGYLYMKGVTGGRAPAALTSGFANKIEAMLDGDPRIMLGAVDYADDHLPSKNDNHWARIVAHLMATGRADSIEQLFTYTFTSLEAAQYAEAWSLTELLGSDPKRYAALVAQVRDGKPAIEALREVYGDEQQLAARWAKLIQGSQ